MVANKVCRRACLFTVNRRNATHKRSDAQRLTPKAQPTLVSSRSCLLAHAFSLTLRPSDQSRHRETQTLRLEPRLGRADHIRHCFGPCIMLCHPHPHAISCPLSFVLCPLFLATTRRRDRYWVLLPSVPGCCVGLGLIVVVVVTIVTIVVVAVQAFRGLGRCVQVTSE
jgi:hypothetical protein